MNSQWFSFATLFLALVIGYAVIVSSDNDQLAQASNQRILHGYYLRDAIVLETDAKGAPHMRFAADEMQQQDDGSLALTAVRVDYLAESANSGESPQPDTSSQPDDPPQHWVVNADRGIVPPRPRAAASRIERPFDRLIKLRGNVTAHVLNSDRIASLAAPSLDIDVQRETASTAEVAVMTIEGHTVQGHGLNADLKRRRVNMGASVAMRVAAADPQQPTAQSPRLSLPEAFEWDAIEYQDNVLLLTRVRSKTPPLVSADRARATGENLENNQVILTGNVRIELPQEGELAAEVATITVREGRVARAEVTGTPVKFQHRLKPGEPPVNGRAKTIDYDVVAQIVRFADDAWFNNGKFEFTSEFIEYNLATGAARGTRGSGGPTRGNTDSPL